MAHFVRTRARPSRVAASILLVLFAFGVTAPTYADPGGNGNGSAKRDAAATTATTAGANGQGADHGKALGKVGRSSTSTTTSSSGGTGTSTTGGPSTKAGKIGPQPISTADANKGGANGKCPGGPYCSTRDGSTSLNGNGNGRAVGKPCAGCVGKADNKNPPGQLPNGKDHNAGYECDRNHGIGRTNPAHSGCKPAKPTPIPTPTPTPKPPVTPKPPSAPAPHGHVAGVQAVAPRPGAVVAGVQAVAPTPSVLPPTGASTLDEALGACGAAMLLGGAALMRRRKRA